MINEVTKHDGSLEKFSPEKLNKWGEWATQNCNVSWSDIALRTFKRLHDKVTTEEIHQTMINVCLYKEDIEYSRVAARLEHASIRKAMERNLGINDKSSFEDIYNTMIRKGLWCSKTLPKYNPYWEDLYKELYQHRFEYWQIAQWVDKYALCLNGVAVETPHIGCLGIAIGLLGDTQDAYDYARSLVRGQINLPTPALNGIRNGDFDTISCCVLTGGDSTDSIAVANHIAYKMTAKKAGIGIEFDTRSKGTSVKNGRTRHLGKHPIYSMLDKSVKCLTQITRGGSATVTFKCIDPEVEDIVMWKSQRVDIETRLDKIDYAFAYNDAFLSAVINNTPWHLFDLAAAPSVHDAFYTTTVEEYNKIVKAHIENSVPHSVVDARALLKKYLTTRNETGRLYCFNVSRANTHTPFLDTVRLSNLCMEIALPTKPYTCMQDLYSKSSQGETAFCTLSAINVLKVPEEEYPKVARLVLKGIDVMIDRAPMMAESMKTSITRRRSVGVGITGLASYLYSKGFDYDGSKESLQLVKDLSERHYYYLLKASQELSEESGIAVEGINTNWLPIDTRIGKQDLLLDWESLRGKARKHSVLVAHMPTESSAVFSDAPNGLYPPRQKIVDKKSRKGVVQYICKEWDDSKKVAWEVDNITLAKYYSVVQDFTDQGISADYYFDPSHYEDEKKPLSELMTEWVAQAKLGVKSQYYVNTRDFNGGTFQDTSVDCESCKL